MLELKPSGDQLAIAKETGRRLGMGTNMYPSSALLGQCKDEAIASIPIDDLIEKADGFAGVFPGETTLSCSPAINFPCECWHALSNLKVDMISSC